MNSIRVIINGKFYPGHFPQEVAQFFLWCQEQNINLGPEPFQALAKYIDSRSSWSKRKDISTSGNAKPILIAEEKEQR